MKKYWQIFWHYRKLRLMKLVEFRQDFFFWSAVSIMWTCFNLFFFTVLVGLQGQIGGWSRAEIYVLQGAFTILDAFTWSFFYRNMMLYTESVFDGALDLVLLKPLDAQFLLSVQDNSYTNVMRLIIGTATILYATSLLPEPPSLLMWIGFIIALFISLILLYAIWFIASTFAFWVDRLENINEIIPSFREVYRTPRTIYTGVFSFLFTAILPLTLISNIPSEILIGRDGMTGILRLLFFTFIFLVIGRLFFRFSIRKYASAGS